MANTAELKVPNKFLLRSSFGLIRTNPRLTTNIKLVADSKNKIYLESIDANPLLSKSIYKGYEVSYKGSYSFDLARFYSQNGTALPEEIAYSVFEEDASLNVKNRYKNQYDFTYGSGFYPKNSKLYSEEYALFAPIWLERDNLPDYFLIFKMDGPVTINPQSSIPGTTSIYPKYDLTYIDNNFETINSQFITTITTPEFPLGYNGDLDEASVINDLLESPSQFFNNIVKNAKIIKTFDLKETSHLGSYIRKHVNDSKFPESSIYANLSRNANSYWNGISYRKGGFCSISNDIYKEYTLSDKTITESDDFLTTGFMRNGVVCANLLNLEFLFDDPDQEEYKFGRYFGLYVSETELGKFFLDKDRLYDDKSNEQFQIPSPIDSSYGDPLSTRSIIQTNHRGIKLYPNVKDNGNNEILPYAGRLLTFEELQNPRFGYVKDLKGNFYSIDNVTDWKTTVITPGETEEDLATRSIDSNYLRIKNKKVDWANFTGVEDPFEYITAFKTSEKGRPAIAFKVVSAISNGDQIRVRYTDPLNPKEELNINTHTIVGSNLIAAGTSNGLTFSTLGTNKQILQAISQSINNIEKYTIDGLEIFRSIVIEDEIIIFCKTQSENWNKLKISFFSDQAVFPFDISNQYEDVKTVNNYIPSPIPNPISPLPSGATSIGKYVESPFFGGNNNSGARAIIERDKILEFVDSKDVIYVKTKSGKYITTGGYGLYLDEPIKSDSGDIIGFKNYKKYFVINLEDFSEDFEFGSSNKIALYKLAKNSCGYLSLFPIKDFDFDFKSNEYNKSGDSNISKLFNWWKGTYLTNTNLSCFGFDGYSNLSEGSANYIENLVGPSSAFIVNGEFQTLNGMQSNELDDTLDIITNEYDRLKENELEELALSSRVVPFINKWVYDNECVDIRENNYRLNSNPAFGYSNFSPSFDITSRNTKFFTHEWYYLQKYPPYMNLDEKINSFSYFDNDIRINPMESPNDPSYLILPELGSPGSTATYLGLTGGTGPLANLLSIEEDYFLSYFTRETVDNLPIKRDFKYSIFSIGDNYRPAETLFRGIKVEIRDRNEFSKINYNKEGLRYLLSEKYNGYKFSAVLTYGNSGTQITCIKNDKFKCVTLLIQADFNNDDLITYTNPITSESGKFIDRSLLYVMKDKQVFNQGPPNTLSFQNKTIQGNIVNWTDNGTDFVVTGGPDANGNLPNFFSDITLNENGSYNSLSITSGALTYTFSGISELLGNQFKCKLITGLPVVGSITPTGWRDLAYVSNNWGFSYIINSAPFKSNPIYDGGGYNAYNSIIESISFASIAQSINSGNPEIRYINVTSNGEIQFNRFCIDLVKPEYPATSTYLMRKALEKTPADLQESSPILGYELTAMPRMNISQISRYRGTYNPKVKNIINFVDTDDIKLESLDYYNVQILTELKTDMNFKYWFNLVGEEFDMESSGFFVDGGTFNVIYYRDSNLGKIKNLYFNKVNVENPNIILSKQTKSRYIYPLIGEIAIDYDDFFTFKSNWDVYYYKKYIKRATKSPVIGTREPKEEKSFFGSKAISIPNEIAIETFPSGFLTLDEFLNARSIYNTDANLVQTIVENPRSTDMEVDVYVTKALQDWLITDGFGEEFYKYINPNYSFGDIGLDDDIKNYISENIFDRYSIKEIVMWEKIWNPIKGVDNPPQIETNLTDIQKMQNGYVRSKNYRTVTDSAGGLDFKLIYTIPRDKKTSIAFSVILEKK